MSGRLYIVLVFIAFCACFEGSHAEQFCIKLDFNQTVAPGITQCKQEALPTYSIKRYADVPQIRPFRPNAKYFLTNYLEGSGCAETIGRFHLNPASTIEAAVFLWQQFRGAYVEMLVVDADRNVPIYSWKNETSKGWIKITLKIAQEIKNAMVNSFFNSILKIASNNIVCWLVHLLSLGSED